MHGDITYLLISTAHKTCKKSSVSFIQVKGQHQRVSLYPCQVKSAGGVFLLSLTSCVPRVGMRNNCAQGTKGT